jgi:hypothetical protein
VLFDHEALLEQLRHGREGRVLVVERCADLRAVRQGDRATEAGADACLDAQMEVSLRRLSVDTAARSPTEYQRTSASRSSPAGIRVGPRTVKLTPGRATAGSLRPQTRAASSWDS